MNYCEANALNIWWKDCITQCEWCSSIEHGPAYYKGEANYPVPGSYSPAPFLKAIAMLRVARGQSIQEIIDYLVSMRVQRN